MSDINKTKRDDSQLVLSYMGLRKVVGYIGVGLPFVLVIGRLLLTGDTHILGSMSSHYYSPVGGIFVGSLCAIGVFLFSYCGYDRRDKIAGRMACAFAVGVAMFPVRPDENFTETQELIGRFHLFSAAALFLTLAYFCLRLFVLTDKKKMTTEKLRRNKVYRTCGWTILGCIAAIGVVEWLFENPYSPYLASRVKEFSPVFWLEAIAVVAFGMSWLTKGEAILADED